MFSLHKSLLAFSTCAAFFAAAAVPGSAVSANPEDILLMELKDGVVTIELHPKSAPEHVKRIRTLVRQGFYNGLFFHRVIDGFMVQTGDPTGTGAGGSSLPNLKAEFNDINHVRGVLSMARTNDPNSANSQFFIMLGDAPYLDHQYTAFGKVIEGMEFVDKIKKGSAANNGAVVNPDKIISIKVMADTVKTDAVKAQ